jgi:hypothetical protein
MLSLFIENIQESLKAKIALIDLEISKISENQKCALKVLQAKKMVYLDVLKDIQLVLHSVSDDTQIEDVIEDILEDKPPYYYLYFAIEDGINKEFYLKTDILITQSNISEMNKKISSLRNTSGVEYGASRVYEVNTIDYIFENGILEKVEHD